MPTSPRLDVGDSGTAPSFKHAGFSGPHPTLVVACPTCGSPKMHYCNDDNGEPTGDPHNERRVAAGTERPQRGAPPLYHESGDSGRRRLM